MKQASPATSSVGHHSPRLATEPPSGGRSRSPHLAGVGAGASASASGTSILDTGSVGAPATDTVAHGAAHDQRQASRNASVASSGVGRELSALAMLACTTPGWMIWPSRLTGPAPEPAARATAFRSAGEAAVGAMEPARVAAPPPPPLCLPAAAACWAWRISEEQSVYSSASALSSLSALL